MAMNFSNNPKTTDGLPYSYKVITRSGLTVTNPQGVSPTIYNTKNPINPALVGVIGYNFTKRIIPISYSFGMPIDFVTGVKVEYTTSLFNAKLSSNDENYIPGVLKRLPLAMNYEPLKKIETSTDRSSAYAGLEYRNLLIDSNDFIDMNSVVYLSTFYTIADMLSKQQFGLLVNTGNPGGDPWGACFSWLELY